MPHMGDPSNPGLDHVDGDPNKPVGLEGEQDRGGPAVARLITEASRGTDHAVE